MKSLCLAMLLSVSVLCASSPEQRLAKATRADRNGWIALHLEGSPRDIGYQHGCLLASEIDDALRMFAFYLKQTTGKDWNFYREAAGRMFWTKLDPEYQQEIAGIAEGLRARGKTYDSLDITALNGNIEITSYYIPALKEKEKPGSGDNLAPGKCSAFIATGSWTEDGRIVMGHNNWSEYIAGERWNIILDVVPEKGYRILMDAFPGFIHSGDDFAMNGAGLLYTETTITQFKGFDENGVPEFMRARKAAQYGRSIDDFVRIMTKGNNGAYANDWLVGDLSSNEIARVELGLKNHRVWRTKDGFYEGSNFASDEKLLAEETTFNVRDSANSPNARKTRWAQLIEKHKGEINAENGMAFESDHVDVRLGGFAANRCVLCGHVDQDSLGTPEFSWAPYFPGGAVQGKVTTAALAKELKFWARMGHPCGEDFIASTFFKAHPEYQWQEPFLRDMKAHPWTLFEAK